MPILHRFGKAQRPLNKVGIKPATHGLIIPIFDCGRHPGFSGVPPGFAGGGGSAKKHDEENRASKPGYVSTERGLGIVLKNRKYHYNSCVIQNIFRHYIICNVRT